MDGRQHKELVVSGRSMDNRSTKIGRVPMKGTVIDRWVDAEDGSERGSLTSGSTLREVRRSENDRGFESKEGRSTATCRVVVIDIGEIVHTVSDDRKIDGYEEAFGYEGLNEGIGCVPMKVGFVPMDGTCRC